MSTSPQLDNPLLERLDAVENRTVKVRHCHTTDHDIELCYQTFGNPTHSCVLLVMGLNGQAPLWEVDFCETILAKGFFVVRYDNRDVGLSTKLDDCPTPSLLQLMLPGICCCCSVPYLLTDMAEDAVALLDALKIARAHVVGISMGGMLAQTIAIHFPERCYSLTSIASTTGAAGQVEPSLSMKLFLARQPASDAEHDLAMHTLEFVRRVGGPRGFDANRVYTLGIHLARRSKYVNGKYRHAGAIVFSGSRLPGLKLLKVPTLVIHGDADELVPTANGRQTSEAVPGSRLIIVPRMGHIIFPEDFESIAGWVAEHARRSESLPH
jgi:pimeloyl-ACP methyl ester carboxylesterase